MKDDGVNRDTTIEVGDLVRVVNSGLTYQNGKEFVVTEKTGRDLWDEDTLYWAKELEIMQPKAALKSVYAEKDSIRHKHLLAYELCEKMHEGYIEYDYLQQELQRIFDDRSGEED